SHRNDSARPRQPSTMNTDCQPITCTTQPISGANSAVAAYCAELEMAVTVARSAVGNQEAMMRALPGKHGALANPTSRRSRNIEVTAQVPGSQPTKPCSRVSADQANSARV